MISSEVPAMAETVRSVLAQRTLHEPEGPRPLTREVEAPEPYPIEALGPLQSAAEAIQMHTRAPVDICAQAVLGAVALATQGHADVVLPSGQVRPTSLYLMTVAASGERKSAVDSLALGAIYDREAKLRETYRTEKAEFDMASRVWEARNAQAMGKLKSTSQRGRDAAVSAEADLRAVGAAPEPPLTPLLVCPDPTFEGYCKLTATGHPALGLFSAEGGAFIGGFGMSPDHKLKTAAGISSIWDGDPIKRVRAGEGSSVLAGRRLSMHLMAQPEVASQMLADDLLMGQGLLSRILVVAPPSAAGTRFFSDPPNAAREALQRYRDDMASMIGAPLPLKAGTRNELSPRALRMTADAARVWIGFHDHIEEHLHDGAAYAPAAGFANKAAEHAARLAAQQILWIDSQAVEITAAAMARAVMLAQHYLGECLRLRSMASTDSHLRLAQRVLDWLQTRWPEPAFHAAALYNDCPIREVRDRRTALRVIKTLEEHGWIRKTPERIRIGGRVRNEAWVMHGRMVV